MQHTNRDRRVKEEKKTRQQRSLWQSPFVCSIGTQLEHYICEEQKQRAMPSASVKYFRKCFISALLLSCSQLAPFSEISLLKQQKKNAPHYLVIYTTFFLTSQIEFNEKTTHTFLMLFQISSHFICSPSSELITVIPAKINNILISMDFENVSCFSAFV